MGDDSGGISALSFFATLGHDAKAPMPPWRRTLMSPMRPLVRLVLFSLGFWHIPVKRLPGSAPPGGAGVVVAAPHYSLIDPFILVWLELPCSVSKAAVRNIPVVGRIATALQCIFVDRKVHAPPLVARLAPRAHPRRASTRRRRVSRAGPVVEEEDGGGHHRARAVGRVAARARLP